MEVQKLTPRIWLYTPETISQGQWVILCSWTDATDRQIDRYVQLHHAVAPGARILLIKTTAAVLVSPFAWQRAALEPAVRYIIDNILRRPDIADDIKTNEQQQQQQQNNERLLEKDKNHPRILFHSLSNGGSLTATQLFFLLHEATHTPLPLIGIIMDSNPDGGNYWQTYKGIVYAQPRSKLGKMAVGLAAHAALLPVWTYYATGLQENSQVVMRRAFLDRDFVDSSFICYVYSKGDPITNWEDVHLHAEEARRKGWTVVEHKLEGSSHCGNIRTNRELYVSIVKQLWDRVKREAKL